MLETLNKKVDQTWQSGLANPSMPDIVSFYVYFISHTSYTHSLVRVCKIIVTLQKPEK